MMGRPQRKTVRVHRVKEEVSEKKSDKELAFLQDLYVSTDWGERFAELVDEHVELPKEGRALYVAAGTGGHAMAMQERVGNELIFTCTDESEECLELARAKAVAMKAKTEFRRVPLEALGFVDDFFDLVIGDASLVAPERLREMFEEMMRVAAPGATVALTLPTSSSFGEFFSIYWEALHNAHMDDHEFDVETLITELPTVSAVEEMAENGGLENISSWTRVEEFDYESGEAFMDSPLITDFLLKNWLSTIEDEEMLARVLSEIKSIIDEERHSMDFALSVKATLVSGRKK